MYAFMRIFRYEERNENDDLDLGSSLDIGYRGEEHRASRL